MATSKVIAGNLKVGSVIMPPERELRLWMRRNLQEMKLPESAVYLTITKIEEGSPDKKGRWILVTADHTTEWLAGNKPYPFRFRVRPETPWTVIA